MLKREKFDATLTIRGPKSLASRVARITEQEDETENYIRVKLMELGATVHDWTWERREGIEGLAMDGEEYRRTVIRMLEAGYAALQAEKRR